MGCTPVHPIPTYYLLIRIRSIRWLMIIVISP
ncbi:hypothetical protein G3A1_040 [Escherichia phage vB_EcoP-G3A1]|uniref:Uncharacterized protein n=1 Tax=Escherichia phage vB_EcoP-101117UKE2 TaxID=2865796 RepID=A0AAE7XT12_9CAUD|nr:hypothetical protein 101117UKE2_040 [Escherichia phage vB_EcoP-101117UKE2]QZI79666.1 hypothetical protein 101118B1_041 [Escherichia phage vB_EcoP-101118B1]QZI81269.1 hypothetical protein G3A1_040 [Escherichia phage vB_EcoP-G3A1]